MAATAPQIQYRQEFIAGFERHQALLRNTVTTETVIKGNQATFLVVDSGSSSAVTRGVNGLIPARNDNNTQYTATLAEWHDLVQKTGFNIFESQGDQRAAMQMTSRAVLNRRIDQDIITELNTATQDTGAATTASLNLALYAKTVLGNAAVPFDGNIYAAITPAFEAYLLQVKEFASTQYVLGQPLASAETAFADKPMAYRWMGVNWIVHPGLPGVGTNAEKCFMYHRNAIGHAVNTGDLTSLIGYNEEQDYSYARATAFVGAKLLQNTGVVVMNHDGSAMLAQ
jgi:hypothetical protein